jgi:CPA2 family monovalent cation:H+ antiporter-2
MAASFSTSGLSDALVILGAAGIVIPTFARFRISPVIGFILVGMLVGPSGLGSLTGQAPWLHYVTISNGAAIEPFAQFGIILLLFSIGLELSFRRLWGMRRLVFGVGAVEFTLIALILGIGLYLLGESAGGAIALGLGLSNSSMALVLPLVRMASPIGRTAFALLLLEDLAIVPVIFVLGVLATHSGAGLGQFGEVVGNGLVVVLVMTLIGRFALPRLFAQAARTKSPELFLSASLLVVIAASLATAAVGLSPIVGALLAGILVAETDYRGEVEIITAPFRGLALGVFLITIGMGIDFGLAASAWPRVAAAVILVLGIKAVGTGLLLRMSGAPRGVAAEAGVLMASPSEMTLIVIVGAAAAGLISAETAAFWQLVTAIGMTVTPLLAKLGRLAARRVDVGAGAPPADEEDEAAQGRVVIFGFGRVGRLVAEMLTAHGRAYIAVDSDIDTVTAARAEGVPVRYGDAARPELLDRLKLDCAGALVLTMDDPVQLVRLVQRVRAMFPDLVIVARARDPGHAAELYQAGATDAVPETVESSLQLSEAVLVDLGMAMGPVIASIHEKRAELRQQIIAEGALAREPPRLGKRLRDAKPR